MQLSEFKTVLEVLQNLNIETSFRDVCENILQDEEDFNVDGYRFINVDSIDKIQMDELESDPYILGCFNASFISENTDLSFDIVKALQDGEKYEELGQHIIDNDFIEDMQQGYCSADGYGHHFAHYDHEEHELNNVNGINYLVFRVD